jgi:hypothetical protein
MNRPVDECTILFAVNHGMLRCSVTGWQPVAEENNEHTIFRQDVLLRYYVTSAEGPLVVLCLLIARSNHACLPLLQPLPPIPRMPQVSILGPLLLLIYINDLPFILKDAGNPTLFADDTSTVYSYPNSIKCVKEIKSSYITLNTWFKNNMLTLNYNKTNFMQFTCKPNNNINLTINNNNNHISNTQSI